ncbi:MAG: cyclase family protein [Saprospiraceae bacterium]|jgi:kynurenine formamidase|nr:cyclase family protein [Saprospiraceae bacterium]MBK6815507.1 cyclase family protein [Saprospiraceae bacterium]MBK7372536.1 cyclase family protein [Saprospiraceae bacterium]MBK7439175.1 cyclase family protein [Saprospiraceae bacterium]MBK7607905.1 cyclase family protein [Saprospiraceae bacterium]
MSTYVDLSHVIDQNVISYKGLPAPLICDYLSRAESKKYYSEGTSFQIGRIDMVGNTGTYIDCPFHRYENGKDLSEVLLTRFVDLPAVKIHVPYSAGLKVDLHHFEQINVKNKAVLIQTDWSDHWMTDGYYHDHPYLATDAAAYLVDQGVLLVGIDSHNIDDTRSNARPVHSILLKNEILIVEHLCQLSRITVDEFLFSAVPPKIKGMGTFPVRAFATMKDEEL